MNWERRVAVGKKQQFNVYLTPPTVRAMKHRAIDAQLSLSDLVERVLSSYLAETTRQKAQEGPMQEKGAESGVTVQPMVHVEEMAAALDFYRALGATVLNGSRDGDWALLRFGGTELGLLAHPPNPEQDEGKVELNFAYSGAMEELEHRLRDAGVTIVRPVVDEGFGYQLQVRAPDGLLIKINQIEPELYQ
jgi:predicted enzyme related to lactoylglutathione lyase